MTVLERIRQVLTACGRVLQDSAADAEENRQGATMLCFLFSASIAIILSKNYFEIFHLTINDGFFA